MPTYEYLCDACQCRFELFESITAQPQKKCPECGRLKLRRLIGPGAAIVFKGSGFYCTDYRSPGYQKAAAADKGSGADGSSGGSSGGNGKVGKASKDSAKAKSTPGTS